MIGSSRSSSATQGHSAIRTHPQYSVLPSSLSIRSAMGRNCGLLVSNSNCVYVSCRRQEGRRECVWTVLLPVSLRPRRPPPPSNWFKATRLVRTKFQMLSAQPSKGTVGFGYSEVTASQRKLQRQGRREAKSFNKRKKKERKKERRRRRV